MVIPRWYFVLLHLIIGFNFDECNPRAPSQLKFSPSLSFKQNPLQEREPYFKSTHIHVYASSIRMRHTHTLTCFDANLSSLLSAFEFLVSWRTLVVGVAPPRIIGLSRALSAVVEMYAMNYDSPVLMKSRSLVLVLSLAGARLLSRERREMCACVRPLSAFMHGSRISMKSPFGG
jgi:hypothetical protein